MSSKDSKSLPSKIAIIDSDLSSAATTERLLLAAGSKQPDIFTDSERGLMAVRSGVFNIVLVDWSLKGPLPCIAILNRIRRNPEQVYFPIVVTTGLIKKDDLRMIQDFQCVEILEKPLRQQTILEGIKKTATEEKWYLTHEQRIANAFNQVPLDPKQALSTISRIIQNSPNPAPLAIIAGQHLSNLKFHLQAQSIYDDILRRDPKNLQALNAKAKLLSKMGRKKEALAVLMRAQEVSPRNLDRLGLMGDLEISLKHPQQAINYFQTALGMDSRDLRSRIGLKIAQNYSVVVDLQAGGTRDEPCIAKLINNLGVQLASRGEFEKALKYYLISFAFLSNDELQSKVSFNLGIGFKKWGKAGPAKYWLERAVSLAGGSYSKAESHLVGMDHINSTPGLAQSTNIVVPVPAIQPPRADEMIPFPVDKKNVDLLSGVRRANGKDDAIIFEEEAMFGSQNKATEKLVQASLDKMIDDIDVDLTGLDQMNFDDAM